MPAYMGESYESFFGRVQEMPHHDQIKIIREAALFVELQKEEVEAIVTFCEDKNGVAYCKENLADMKPDQILEMIVAVCGEIAKIKIDLVTDNEKKNSLISAST